MMALIARSQLNIDTDIQQTLLDFARHYLFVHEPLIDLLGVQASMGAVLAATMVVTSPVAYAAPFDTGTGMAPTGELHIYSSPLSEQNSQS